MPWKEIEQWSWIATLVGTPLAVLSLLISFIALLMTNRANKQATRELTVFLSEAMGKPEMLQKLELETRQRSEASRRRTRKVLVPLAAAGGFMTMVAVAVIVLANLPDHVSTTVVGGDAPRTVQECVSAQEASRCFPMHVYELAAGAKVETRFGGIDRSPAAKGQGGLSVELPGCESEVRWHVDLDGQTVAEAVSRDVLVNVKFPMTSDREYTFVAERAGGDCATTEVRVRTGFTFDG